MTKTHGAGGHFGKWRLPPLCHPQPTNTIKNHDLHIHTITGIYHNIYYHQNCHEITYAPGLYVIYQFAVVSLNQEKLIFCRLYVYECIKLHKSCLV